MKGVGEGVCHKINTEGKVIFIVVLGNARHGKPVLSVQDSHKFNFAM